MGWPKLVMVLVNIVFVKQNINQVLFILFTKLVNCTFAVKLYCLNLLNNFFLKFFGHGKSPWCPEMLFGLGVEWSTLL